VVHISLKIKKIDALETEVQELRKKLATTEELLETNMRDFAYTSELASASFYSNAQLASVSELTTGRFLDVNDMWVTTRGFTREEAIGKTADELNIWGDTENRSQILKDIHETGRLRNYETTSVMRSGETREFILNAEILHINGRQLLFFSGMDITERKKYENNLKRSQKMDAVGQLTGGIAHDFNNLLGIIQGNLELIEESLPDNAQLKKLVNSALHGTNRGVSLTRKLLSFSSQHASGNLSANANDLILNTKDLIAKSLTASIFIETRLSPASLKIMVDPGDFEDSIINLCMNAHDAMPEGGNILIESFTSTLTEQYAQLNPGVEPGEYIAVRITDTGTGMSPETKEHIFEPFFSTKSCGKGTGLGLSMVFGFISRSNGHIQVQSNLNEGSCFTLYFPKSETPQEVNDPAQLADNSKEPMPQGNETVLVVDDEGYLVEIAGTFLKRLGYKVITTTEPAEALDIIRKNSDIDLLFTDIVMPGSMNGFQLAAAAREFRSDIKILLTSGYSKANDLLTPEIARKIDDLIQNTLPKPYPHVQMAKAVRKALN
jgi:PAS domain S-box-containing protein